MMVHWSWPGFVDELVQGGAGQVVSARSGLCHLSMHSMIMAARALGCGIVKGVFKNFEGCGFGR